MTGNTLNLDPGLFWPALITGRRDKNVFPLYGQFKNAGAVTGGLFPTNAPQFITGAIGQDAPIGAGVIGTGTASANTLNGSVSAGATSVVLTSATGYTTGLFIQIDVNVATVGPTSEVRKITSVASNTVNFAEPLGYAHLSGAATKVVTAPFTHTINQLEFSLPSFTVEKNLGGFESLQFAGSRVGKLDIKCAATNSEVTMTADIQSKSVAVLPTPTTTTYTNELPFVFWQASLSLFGQAVAQATTANFALHNTLKDTFTLNGSHNLQFLSPVARVIECKTDVVFTSLDDPTWGYWTLMSNQANNTQAAAAFLFTVTQPGSAGAWTFSVPSCYIKSYSDAVKIDDVIISSITLDGALNVTTGVTVSATLVSPSVCVAY